MKRIHQMLMAAVVALGLSAALASIAHADVNVVNESGETLYVAVGQAIGGRIVYYGWTRIDHNHRAEVYAGSAPRIMLAVLSIRNNAPYAWRINNPIASAEMTVAADDFRCQQVGSAIPQWEMTNLGQNTVWVYDDAHPWPVDMNLFTTMFYVVPGNLDQRFIP